VKRFLALAAVSVLAFVVVGCASTTRYSIKSGDSVASFDLPTSWTLLSKAATVDGTRILAPDNPAAFSRDSDTGKIDVMHSALPMGFDLTKDRQEHIDRPGDFIEGAVQNVTAIQESKVNESGVQSYDFEQVLNGKVSYYTRYQVTGPSGDYIWIGVRGSNQADADAVRVSASALIQSLSWE
jgi:hypothetical protein